MYLVEASDITAPYNQRLLSSTPQDTPVKIVGKASVSTLLQVNITVITPYFSFNVL